jgi:magnesium transporter
MATVAPAGDAEWEQFGLFVGRAAESSPGGSDFVITFQETPGDCLEPLRERLRQGRAALREGGAGYLACMLVDAVVDGYFPVLEAYGERLDALETAVLTRPSRDTLRTIYKLKHELMGIRRAVWPLRDTLSQLLRDRSPLLGDTVLPYLRDTTDHSIQLVDVIETYRELAASFVDVYLSSLANRTNEAMRVLTVIATIFIPLTFLAGVYGMNFDTMPELRWTYGYLAFWIVSLLLAGSLLLAFHRLGWLKRP